jgi:hypothetical protein
VFIVTVLHNCKPDMVKQAEQRIDRNGDHMAAVLGFLFRYRMVSKSDPLAIGTITGWADEAAYERWIQMKGDLSDIGPSPYLSAKSDKFFVCRSHNAAQ